MSRSIPGSTVSRIGVGAVAIVASLAFLVGVQVGIARGRALGSYEAWTSDLGALDAAGEERAYWIVCGSPPDSAGPRTFAAPDESGAVRCLPERIP